MAISFEIVPRDEQATKTQIEFIGKHLDFVDTINVPDLLRLPIRSWDADQYVNRQHYQFIPHVRSIDFDLKTERLQKIIEQHQLNNILIVSGDPPPDMSHQIYDTDVLDLIKIIRADFPEIKIFAGFDPYRSSIKQERQYIEKKFNAGVDAILSQPFFDMRLLEIYSEFIPSDKVYWGISPVVTDKSKAYWEKMNHAIFPADYQATYDWNIETAKRILEFATDQGSHVYFMPIRINLESYFLPLLDMARKLIGNTKT